MTIEDIQKMTLTEVKNLEENLWNIPNVNGQSQVPYLYDHNIHELLNACMQRRKQLRKI